MRWPITNLELEGGEGSGGGGGDGVGGGVGGPAALQSMEATVFVATLPVACALTVNSPGGDEGNSWQPTG